MISLLSPRGVTQWDAAATSGGPAGGIMANKDKGGRSNKKVAAKSLKEKRQAKQAKKAEKSGSHTPL